MSGIPEGKKHLQEAIEFLDALIVQLQDSTDLEKMKSSILRYGLMVPVIVQKNEPVESGMSPEQMRRFLNSTPGELQRSIAKLRSDEVAGCEHAILTLKTLLREWENVEHDRPS